MESLKKFEDICEKDVRQDSFSVLDTKHPGLFRKRTLEDFYRAADSISLHEGVPEEIRNHFQTARNLIIYSWFYYPFNVTAQLCAYISVEFALRWKTGDRKTHFASLLNAAVSEGRILDEGFSIVRKRRKAIQRHKEELPSEFQFPEQPMIRQYSDALAKALPFLRNELAHGCSMLHEKGALQVRICAELINQLFPEPVKKQAPDAASTDASKAGLGG